MELEGESWSSVGECSWKEWEGESWSSVGKRETECSWKECGVVPGSVGLSL